MNERLPASKAYPVSEYADRVSAETLIGFEYKPRVYSAGQNISGRHPDVARGVVDIPGKSSFPAYIINGGSYAEGVMINRHDGTVSLLLAPRDEILTQSDLAEAVDFWENGRDNQIFCLYEKSCGAVVYTDTDEGRKFLMIRMNLGHCGLPKGHVEKFETERETALREIFEETGVRASLLDGFRETVEYQISAKTRKESVYFIGHFDGDDVKIQESEIRAYKLCPFDEACSYVTHANDRAILEDANKWLESNSI